MAQNVATAVCQPGSITLYQTMLLNSCPDASREPHLAADAHHLARLARALAVATLAAGLAACAVRPLPPAEPLAVAAPDAVPGTQSKERRVPAQRVKPGDQALGEFVSAYTCGWRDITVGRMGLGLRLTDGADVFDLDPVPGTSGQLGGQVFQGRGLAGAARVALTGTDVSVDVNGQTLRSCVLARQWPVASFKAVGQAPGWLLKSDPEALHWTLADKLFSTRLTAAQPLTLAQPIRVGGEPGAPVVSVTHSLCRDTATGMPFPYTVDVVYEGRTLRGCGGEPGALLIGRTWVVTGVGAQPMGVAGGGGGPLSPLGHEVTVRFDGKGRVSGMGHCNRFSGIYALTGERLSVGAVVVTRRACLGSALQAEQAFLRALETVVGFDVSVTGELNLATREAAERGQRAGIWAR